MSDADAIWICSKCFLYCLRSDLFAAEGADAKNAYTKSTKSVCTRSVCIKNSYVENVSAVEYLEMHLQSFQIPKVKLFETRLEIRVRAN